MNLKESMEETLRKDREKRNIIKTQTQKQTTNQKMLY